MAMIERQHTKFVQAAISVAPEVAGTAPNTPYTLAAEFETIICDPVLPVIPEPELIDDSDQVGDGTEGPKDPRPGKTPSPQVTLGAKLSNVFPARLMKRFLGGTVVNSAPIVTGVYDHTVGMQARTSFVPQLTTVAMLLGGADPILSSMGVNTVDISQTGTDDPKISFGLMGSGHYKFFRDAYRVQVITITGTPAGGSVICDFDGQPVTIPYNSSAATLLGLLEALSNIAPGDISVTGGPLPGTPLVVTFLNTGLFVNDDVPLITVTTNNLTGGTAPAMTINPQVPLLVLPAAPDYTDRYMHPISFAVSLNNGDVVDVCAKGLLNNQVQMTQNLEWTSMPCIDQFIVPGDTRSGTYMGLVSRGERKVNVSFEWYLSSTLDERYWKRRNLSITSVTITYRGGRIGSTAYYHTFELTIPLSKLMSLEIGSGGNWGTVKAALLTEWSNPSGFISFRSRDNQATLT
jgi:hypothetical protein